MGSDRRTSRGTRSLVVAALIAGLLFGACGRADDRLASGSPTCLSDVGPAQLSTLFDREPGGVIAADYQRAVPLPDGRVLWLYQDATIRLPPSPAPTTTVGDGPPAPPPPTEQLLHNIGIVQTGTCFEVLRNGTAADPLPWLFPTATIPHGHWFWPLDATLGSDGTLYVFVAEVTERGPLYLSATVPIATRIVGVDPVTLKVVFTGSPPNDSTSLYGFSITSDTRWTYLYGQCHRQFGWDPGRFGIPAHDLSCAASVPVARVPRGHLFDQPEYWDGQRWQHDPDRAVAVIPTVGRAVNPSQIRWTGGEFVSITKVGDWFGSTIYLDRAPAAQGPWTNYARLPATPKCARTVCNTYFASWVPWNAGTDFVIGLSHNRWDGRLSAVNRPSFMTAPRPGAHGFALRCAIVDC
ncbi:MAG: hypothetical protein HKN44_00985 [Ilumatobacter sp.]|nr:hypothetical protein [Ilumatobacter sp.]